MMGRVAGGGDRLEIFYNPRDYQLPLREVRERDDGSLQVRRKENAHLTQQLAFLCGFSVFLIGSSCYISALILRSDITYA